MSRKQEKKPPSVNVTTFQQALPRDKANYVTSVIRMRAELRHLMGTARDKDVVEELVVLDSFFEDSVSLIYQRAREDGGRAA